MTANSLTHHRGLSDVAERQMRAWAHKLQSQQQPTHKPPAKVIRELVQPYVAISRETGINGGAFARRVAAQLNWKAFDDNLLDYLAEHYHWSRLSLEFVDEKSASWFHEMFGKWLDRQLISQAEYVRGLGKVVLLAAQHESTVFVGRGVRFILPRASGLAVRLIAPVKQRIETVMRLRECNRDEAEDFVEESDRGRRQFVERYFHHDIAQPHFYDLVINLAHVTVDDAVALVVDQCRRRFPENVLASG
jgi:hypothetical protein